MVWSSTWKHLQAMVLWVGSFLPGWPFHANVFLFVYKSNQNMTNWSDKKFQPDGGNSHQTAEFGGVYMSFPTAAHMFQCVWIPKYAKYARIAANLPGINFAWNGKKCLSLSDNNIWSRYIGYWSGWFLTASNLWQKICVFIRNLVFKCV